MGVGPGHKARPPRGSGQRQSWVPADSQRRLQGDSSSPLIHYSAWEKASESPPPELRQPAGARKATGTCAWGCFSTICLCCLLPSACVQYLRSGLLVQETQCNQHHSDSEARVNDELKKIKSDWSTLPTDSLQSILGLILRLLLPVLLTVQESSSNP